MDTAAESELARVIIPGVPRPLGCNSCLAAMAAVLQALGEQTSYTYLMGASSRAFRLQFSWCPSAPSAYIGFEVWPAALDAAGCEWEQHQLFGAEEIPPAVRDAVRASIDAGRPVLFGSEEDGVLVGYEPVSADNPTGWLARPGPVGPAPDEPYVRPITRIPWGVALLQKRSGDPPASRDRALWALHTAVTNARRGDYDGLAIGFAAWEKWIDELAELERIVDETRAQLEANGRGDEDAAFSIQLGNAWCYESLLFARQDAARYLRSIAEEWPVEAAVHLRAAAGAYEAVHQPSDSEDRWTTGLAAYDRWIAALEKESQKVDGLGQHYNAMCWAECRHYAPLFLEEARRRLGRPDLGAPFEAAIGHYVTVAAKLSELSRLSPMDWAKPEAASERFRDPAVRKQWVDLLLEARDAEIQGVEALKELLAGMDG